MLLKRHVLAGLLFIAWLAACALAFWWFQLRYLGNFENHLATFTGQELAQIQLAPGKMKSALVLHFVDPDCPCSRFAKPHIDELEQRFNQQVEFHNWSTEKKRWPKTLTIPVSPAVAIWNSDGELAYFGPYSGGAICGQGKDFVASTLERVAHGHNPKWINQDAVGCFCTWSKSQQASQEV